DGLVKNVLSTTLNIQSGDDVMVETWDHGLPIADAFIYQLRKMDARPMLLFEHEEAFWKRTTSLSESVLGKVGEHEWAAMEKAKGYVFIPGPANFTRVWKNLSKFHSAVSYNREWYERAKRYRLKAARILLGYASRERARGSKISFTAWQRMLLDASNINYEALKAQMTKVAALLRNGQVHITASNGTDLNLRLAGRNAYPEDCIVDNDDLDQGRNVANIPGGNLLVCPDESYADGTIVFDRPTPYMGKWVNGIRFTFKNGKLTKHRARFNANLLKASYNEATGERDQVAILEIGLNPRARIGFLQDTICAGAITVGIGGNDDVGGANKTNFYFPGVITKATLTVDDNPIVQNGKVTVT
ncbi:MAG TPA: aminopeptidase, partial [Candidatus Bathyarchaeia archaeon]|nr:aminopeptidase [Candidatus Bathyarchaeia archaeon]